MYQEAVEAGVYYVALQLEDNASPTDTVPLSSVPPQFVVSLFSSYYYFCEDRPEFISPTRLDGSCVGVPFNSTWQEQVVLSNDLEDLR